MTKKEQINLILLNIAYKVHYADWNWKEVNSPFARIYLVESGTAKVAMPDGVYKIEPGYLYLIPSFVTHSYENDSTFTLYYIHVYDEHDIFDRYSFPFKVEASDLDYLLMQRLLGINPGRELADSDPDTYDNLPTMIQNIAKSSQYPYNSILETEGILLQLLSRFLTTTTFKLDITDKRILRVVRFIRENINHNILIDDLAEICYLTNDHFIRIFKKEMHCTPIQYINQKKIEKAQLMLVINQESIKQIAYNLSFENISYFYQLFKKITGLTPKQYKEKCLMNRSLRSRPSKRHYAVEIK